MEGDEPRYFELLTAMWSVVKVTRAIVREHDESECPGCDLCIDAQGIGYAVETFYEGVRSDAPSRMVARIEERGMADPELPGP